MELSRSPGLRALLRRHHDIVERIHYCELDGLLGTMVGLLGPLLIVTMGLFVMGIVFAMLLPIFEMNQLIH